MNLIDAIKSGRPIRRTGRSIWVRPWGKETITHSCDAKRDEWFDPVFYLDAISVTKEDLLADDWETRPSEDEKLAARIDHIIRETGIRPTVLDLEPKAFDRLRNEITFRLHFGKDKEDASGFDFIDCFGIRVVKGRVA